MKRGIFEAMVKASVLTAFLSVSAYATEQIRVVWDDDPSSTATIGFADSAGSFIKIGTLTDQDSWKFHIRNDKVSFGKSGDVIISKFVRLSGLKSDKEYYFKVCADDNDESCSNKLYYFKTASNDAQQMTMIAGGDSRHDEDAFSTRVKANKMVAKIRPDFIAFGGDYTNKNNGSEMSDWLDDWQDTFSNDKIGEDYYKRVYPIVPTQGNHERDDGDSSTLCTVFGINKDDKIETCTNEEKYYAINIGNLVRLYTLNTEIKDDDKYDDYKESHMWDDQQEWLENDLTANASSVTWRVAQYHRAMIPSSDNKHSYLNIRKWGPVFETGKLNLAIECDTHLAKYTLPVKHDSIFNKEHDDDYIDADEADDFYIKSKDGGTVYIGEGGWGVKPRDPREVNEPWWIASAKIRQFKVIQFDGEQKKMKIRSVMFDEDIEAIDGISRDRRNDDPFALPAKIRLWDPIESDTSIFDTGDVYTLELSKDNLSKVANVIEKRVDDWDDTAEEDSDDGEMYRVSSDLEMTEDYGNQQIVGIRFDKLDIPKGVIITKAYIQFTVDKESTGYTDLTITTENTADATYFKNEEDDISDRGTLDTRISWKPSAWNEEDKGLAKRTVDLKEIIQPLVEKGDWQPNNAIAFIITGEGKRVAVSSNEDNKVANNEDVDEDNKIFTYAGAPLLYIEYEESSTIIEKRVDDWDDTAEEDSDDGEMYRVSSDLEMTEDYGNQIVGIRFDKLDIPKGVIITKAYIEFTVDEESTGYADLTITTENTSDATYFKDEVNDISDRGTLYTSISWNPSAWDEEDIGSTKRTVDLKEIIQPLVDKESWQPNNAIAFIITGEGKRVAVSAIENNDYVGAPLLHIEYK